jgi:flagellar biogenesis protein FliO
MELMDYSRFFVSLALVIGLIWLVAYGLKRSGLDKRLRGVTGQQGRLAVVDVLYLDPRRRLTLVRADAREYLLLISGDQAQVIDSKDVNPHETKV